MATFEAIFLKINEIPNSRFFQNIRSLLQKNGLRFSTDSIFRFQENYSWIQIQELPWITHLLEKKDTDFVPKFASVLSDNYQTEIVCLYTQTVVDAVGYWHFENGNEKRCLIHGFYQERIWEAVRGESEEWENNLFFDLEQYSDILLEDDDFAKEIVEMCKTKQIKLGSGVPFFSGTDIAKIAKHYQLPGFSFSKGWSVEEKI